MSTNNKYNDPKYVFVKTLKLLQFSFYLW